PAPNPPSSVWISRRRSMSVAFCSRACLALLDTMRRIDGLALATEFVDEFLRYPSRLPSRISDPFVVLKNLPLEPYVRLGLAWRRSVEPGEAIGKVSRHHDSRKSVGIVEDRETVADALPWKVSLEHTDAPEPSASTVHERAVLGEVAGDLAPALRRVQT